MYSYNPEQPVTVNLTRTGTKALTGLVGLVAVGVGALAIALPGASHTRPVTVSQPSPAYAPLIQYRGTGAPPATTTVSQREPAYIRAEHGRGAVP